MTERTNFYGRGNDPFRCLYCDTEVLPLASGYRNHCPECLRSRHVDVVPGDRRNPCGGRMDAVALQGSEGAGWVIVHRCAKCGATQRNRSAEKDPVQADSWARLIELSSEPPRR